MRLFVFIVVGLFLISLTGLAAAAPSVVSITKASTDPVVTGTTSVNYSVLFNQAVQGVNVGNFVATQVSGNPSADMSAVAGPSIVNLVNVPLSANIAGGTLLGNATMDGTNYLQFTSAGSQSGGWYYNPGSTVVVPAFRVSFNLYIGGGTGADGFGCGYGANANALFAEEGLTTGNGVSVGFDTYDNGGEGTIPNIAIKCNTAWVSPGPYVTEPLRTASWVPVVFEVLYNGSSYTCNLRWNSIQVFSNVALTGYSPQAGWCFGFGARTGGSWDYHRIQNLTIQSSDRTVTLNNLYGTGSLRMDVLSPSAQSGPTIQDMDGNSLTGGFTSGQAYTFNLGGPSTTPALASLTPIDPSPVYPPTTSARYQAVFTKPVQTVASSNFAVTNVSGTAAASVSATAGPTYSYTESFAGAPAQGALYGNGASVSGGVLHLTEAVDGEQGSWFFTPSQTLTAFRCTYSLQIGAGSTPGADGAWFAYTPSASNTTYTAEGPPLGLVLSFDTYDNGSEGTPNITVRYNGTDCLVTNKTLITSNFQPVTITVSTTGLCTVTHGGTVVARDVVLPGWSPLATWSIGVGAATGGYNDAQYVQAFTLQNSTYNVTMSGFSGSGNIRLDMKNAAITDYFSNAVSPVNVNGSANYMIDFTPPTGSIAINSGAAYTNTTGVTLTLSATDYSPGSGMTGGHMRFSNDGSTWSSWQTYATSAPWALTTGDGLKTVYAQYMDVAGNASGSYTSTITLDTTSPTVTLWTSAGAYVTTPTGAIGVTVTLSEAVSDLVAGSISTTNALVSGLSSSDSTHYSFTLTPVVEGPFACTIAANAIHDLATNGNLASNGINCTWDKTPPAATVITPSTLYTNSASVSFSVTFSEPVVGFASASNVVVATTGGTAYSGVSVTGSGSSYTVAVGGLSGNGTLTVAVSLASGVTDLAGNALASSVTSAAVTTDYTPPHATSITTTNPNPTNSNTVSFTVNFDEPVLNFNNVNDVVVTSAGISYNGVSISGGPQTYTLSLTNVTGDGTVEVAVSTLSDVTDRAGNALASSVTSALVTVDHTPPHCVAVTANTPSPTNANTVSFTVTFDESVLNFNNASDVVITQTGTVAHTGVVVTGAAETYTVQVTGVTGDGTMTLAASTASDITDLAANALASSVTSNAVSVDHTGPSATGIVAQNPSPTNSGTVIYNVTFSETVVNFNTASDLVITRTGTVTNSGVVITGSGSTYVVDLTGVSGDGTLRVLVNTSSDIEDLATNAMVSSVTSSVLTVDQTAPTVTAITPSGANPTNGSTVPFTVAFSEPVQNFTAANDVVITATGTAAYTGATITGGPATYTATVTGVTGSGTLALAVSTASDVSDLAGNPLASSVTSGAVTVDHTPPVVTVDSLITNNPMPTVSGTVSDNIGVAGVLVTVNGNTYPAVVALGTWTAAVTDALPQGTYDVLARAADTAGNTATDSTTNELVVDLTPPTVTVASQITGNPKPTLSGTVSDNVGVAGVTATVNGHTYTATVSSGTWTAVVTNALPAGTYDVVAQATDTAGNTATDSTTNELTIDFNVPVVTVNPLITNNPAPAVTGTATAQAGHNITSVSVVIHGVTYPYTPGTPANSVTWTVTPSPLPDGTYDVQATARDELGRTGNDGTLNELTIDTVAPTAAITLLAPVETGRDALPFHILFSEAVTGFDAGVITLAGTLTGTVTVTGSSPDYTVTVTLDSPDTDGTLGIVIGSGVTDLAGNAYAGGTSPVYSVFNWRGFTAQPQNARLYSGDTQTFTVVANCGATTLAYQWKWDDGTKAVHDGPTTSTWTITPVSPANAGTYWCEVSYDGAVNPSATATLAVADHLAITGQPQGGQKVTGTSQTFTVGTSGGFAPLAYQWMKDGSQILNATDATYTIGSLQLGDAGSYTVEVSDADSDVRASDPAILTVSGSALPLAEAAGYAALLLAVMGVRALQRKK